MLPFRDLTVVLVFDAGNSEVRDTSLFPCVGSI
jgi:hypothetical protein